MSQELEQHNDADTFSIELLGVDAGETDATGWTELSLQTDQGDISCRWLGTEEGDAAVLWVFGAGGGFHGPAGGLYDRLGEQLIEQEISSLQVAFRNPGELIPSVLDVLVASGFLGALGRQRVIAVGHSFGGAVVINAGMLSDSVTAVAALSTQLHGAETIERLSPKPLFLGHGEADEVLPDSTSRTLYEAAGEPKQLKLYPACGHGLDECQEQLDQDLTNWIRTVLSNG